MTRVREDRKKHCSNAREGIARGGEASWLDTFSQQSIHTWDPVSNSALRHRKMTSTHHPRHFLPRFLFMYSTNSSSRYGHAADSSKLEKSGLIV